MKLDGKCQKKFEEWVLSDSKNEMFNGIIYHNPQGKTVRVEYIAKELLREIYRRFFRSIGIICYTIPEGYQEKWSSICMFDDDSEFHYINIEDDCKTFIDDDDAMDNALQKANNYYNNCLSYGIS